MARFVCGPGRFVLPQMTLMLISLCKEELTRQPMFNSSDRRPPKDLPLLSVLSVKPAETPCVHMHVFTV